MAGRSAKLRPAVPREISDLVAGRRQVHSLGGSVRLRTAVAYYPASFVPNPADPKHHRLKSPRPRRGRHGQGLKINVSSAASESAGTSRRSNPAFGPTLAPETSVIPPVVERHRADLHFLCRDGEIRTRDPLTPSKQPHISIHPATSRSALSLLASVFGVPFVSEEIWKSLAYMLAYIPLPVVVRHTHRRGTHRRQPRRDPVADLR